MPPLPMYFPVIPALEPKPPSLLVTILTTPPPELHLLPLPACLVIFKPPTHPACFPSIKAKSPSSSRQSEQTALPFTASYYFFSSSAAQVVEPAMEQGSERNAPGQMLKCRKSGPMTGWKSLSSPLSSSSAPTSSHQPTCRSITSCRC